MKQTKIEFLKMAKMYADAEKKGIGTGWFLQWYLFTKHFSSMPDSVRDAMIEDGTLEAHPLDPQYFRITEQGEAALDAAAGQPALPASVDLSVAEYIREQHFEQGEFVILQHQHHGGKRPVFAWITEVIVRKDIDWPVEYDVEYGRWGSARVTALSLKSIE